MGYLVNAVFLPQGTLFMQAENGERWRTLCQQITTEQDPDRLIELATEITRLLDEKEERLKGSLQSLRSA